MEQVLAGVGAQYSPKGATAIVMNPQTGAIMALANWPRVNANDPTSAPTYASQDRAVNFNYEPGSTFKAFTVAGALQDGLVTPSTLFNIPSVLQIADRKIHDAEVHGDETLSVADILKKSSNIGADEIGAKLGAQLGSTTGPGALASATNTGVNLPGEDGGIILPVSKYSGSSMGNLPFGQGESVTPMQIATAYAAIANGGMLRPPHVVESIGGRSLPVPTGHRIISTASGSQLRGMLRGVLRRGWHRLGRGYPGLRHGGQDRHRKYRGRRQVLRHPVRRLVRRHGSGQPPESARPCRRRPAARVDLRGCGGCPGISEDRRLGGAVPGDLSALTFGGDQLRMNDGIRPMGAGGASRAGLRGWRAQRGVPRWNSAISSR